MADVARAGARVVRSQGYYLSTGFSTGGRDVLWEDIYNEARPALARRPEWHRAQYVPIPVL